VSKMGLTPTAALEALAIWYGLALQEPATVRLPMQRETRDRSSNASVRCDNKDPCYASLFALGSQIAPEFHHLWYQTVSVANRECRHVVYKETAAWPLRTPLYNTD
jgi:hypothetical protein